MTRSYGVRNKKSETGTSNGGIGFAGALTIVLIVLKLIDKIDWSWWWVLSPLWISAALWMLAALILLIYD